MAKSQLNPYSMVTLYKMCTNMLVGVEKALSQSGFDAQMFEERGGVYEWNKGNNCTIGSALQDIEDLQ